MNKRGTSCKCSRYTKYFIILFDFDSTVVLKACDYHHFTTSSVKHNKNVDNIQLWKLPIMSSGWRWWWWWEFSTTCEIGWPTTAASPGGAATHPDRGWWPCHHASTFTSTPCRQPVLLCWWHLSCPTPCCSSLQSGWAWLSLSLLLSFSRQGW